MNKIAVHGVTGRAGSRIATELLSRGHAVNGIARNTAEAAKPGRPEPATGRRVACRISAMRFDGGPIFDVLLQAIRVAGVPRLLVGGAGWLGIGTARAVDVAIVS